MDTYEEVRDWLYEQLPAYQKKGSSAYKPGLENIERFLDYLGNPHQDFLSIHIAGTNGKGSTAHMINSVLMEANYKVGLYTSPHLKDFTERIRINGIAIEEGYVVEFINKHKSYFVEAKLSFFELTVGMSFTYFKDQNIDVAVVEVGLGGRLDATNVITPILSVITNIGFDHTQFLGNTLSSIAKEKAGIIKKRIPVVIGETQHEIVSVFKNKSKTLNAPIYWADQLHQKKYKSDLVGLYQSKNIQTTKVVFDVLELEGITTEHIELGLQKVVFNTGLKGRWQQLQKSPTIIADVTHNESGFRYVVDQIEKMKYNRLHFVLGFVKDKDLSSIFNILPKEAIYYISTPNISRAEKISMVMQLAKKNKLNVSSFDTIDKAYKSACNNSEKEDIIYVGGSTFVVAEIL
ncbi:MAG: bifunctional folylpolyglutamate synthase/dihydrofolate synthase [Flavobacteriaceae bacterium]|nr:bifunctional folylpolyglutamate synthase/dihydrofolate synthase [Flavobacteriaceae bacterium]